MVYADGVNKHIKSGPGIWRIPFGFQLVPAGIMCFGLLFATESPRWLAQKGRNHEALTNLAKLRRLSPEHESVRMEMAGKGCLFPWQCMLLTRKQKSRHPLKKRGLRARA
jgi:hypothetical protein